MIYWDTELYELIGLTAFIGALGALVCFYAFRAYSRSRQRSMAFLGLGIALVSLGSALSWWGFWWAGWDPVECQMGTVGVSTAGFVSLIYSLRTRAG